MNAGRYLGESKGDPEEMLAGRLHLHYDFPPYCTNETGKVRCENGLNPSNVCVVFALVLYLIECVFCS